MTKRTRLFMGFAVGVLVVGLGTGFVTSYYGLPVLAQFGSDGPVELAYIPADSHLVAFANVRDLMDSELRRKVLELRPDRPGPTPDPDPNPNPDPDSNADPDPDPQSPGDLLQQAGIDIETDVDRVVIGMAGESAIERERPLVLARGRFDDDLIETMVRQRGGQVEDYRGTRLLTHASGDQAVGLAFVEPDLVAFGTAAAVRRAIDTKAGAAGSIVTNEEVMTLVRDIDGGNAWAVGRFDAISGRARLPQELVSQLPAINWFAATGHVNGGVDGVIRIETRDETAAQDFRDVVQGFLALVRLQAGQQAQFRALANSLQLGGTGRTVSVSFSVPAEMIDALAAFQQQRGGPGRAPGATPPPETPAPAVPRT
jgi:hypothetical protein